MKNERLHYRKNLSFSAFLLLENDEERAFTILNLSLGGVKAHFDDAQRLPPEDTVRIKLPALKLEGYMFPVWEKAAEGGGLDVGFEFSSLEGVDGNRYLYRDDHHPALSPVSYE